MQGRLARKNPETHQSEGSSEYSFLMYKNHQLKTDRIFDGWAKRFEQRIYADDNPKGLIRATIVQRDIQEVVLNQANSPLRILEVGAGLGQMSLWLAKSQHRVVLTEPSQDMLQSARHQCQSSNYSGTIEFKRSTLQQLDPNTLGRFDLIICHAVLEWLAEPEKALSYLAPLLETHGFLSIMFYNKHSGLMRSLIVGDFERVLKDRLAGDGKKSLSPISPLDPQKVANWVEGAELKTLRWTGVRCFYDYMLPKIRLSTDIQSILDMEKKLSLQQAWRSMARYQHIICQGSDMR